MLSQVASHHGGSAPTGLPVLKALPTPSWTLWGGGPMEMKGHLWGPHCKPVPGAGADPVPVPAPSAQGPGHRRMAQQGHGERETGLGDIRAMNPIIERLSAPKPMLKPHHVTLLSEAKRNRQTCSSFTTPPR